jgi:hypothetical protein
MSDQKKRNMTPKAGPDLCADCEHEREYHNTAGCGIEQCGCQEFTRTASLRDAMRTILRGFTEGVFVRSTAGDADPAWAITVLPYIRALAIVQERLGEAGSPMSDQG